MLAVEQVLRLLHYLVMYGYYGNTDDIKQLLTPLLDLLDGRNDKPYPRAGAKKAECKIVHVLQILAYLLAAPDNCLFGELKPDTLIALSIENYAEMRLGAGVRDEHCDTA